MRYILQTLSLSFILFAISSCAPNSQSEAEAENHLGEVLFSVTGKAEAQPHFENDPKTTEDWLRKATELEGKISYSYGPPF